MALTHSVREMYRFRIHPTSRECNGWPDFLMAHIRDENVDVRAREKGSEADFQFISHKVSRKG
jgi:hypothetical protein